MEVILKLVKGETGDCTGCVFKGLDGDCNANGLIAGGRESLFPCDNDHIWIIK